MKFTTVFIVSTLLLLVGCKSYQLSDVKAERRIKVEQKNENDSSLIKMISPYQEEMKNKMDAVIGFAPQALERAKPESNLGNFVADLSFKYGFEFLQQEQKVKDSSNVICLLNHGGLRSVISKGDVTIGSCYSLMPFENEIVIVEISGTKMIQIQKYLENSGGEPIANMNLDITVFSNTKREVNCTIGGIQFDPNQNYFVVTSDYLAKGGDKMDFFLDPISLTQTGKLLRDAIIDAVKDQKTIKAETDGRLKIKKDE